MQMLSCDVHGLPYKKRRIRDKSKPKLPTTTCTQADVIFLSQGQLITKGRGN